jgi:hypothetical protein
VPDDEVVIGSSYGPTCEAVVLQPDAGVDLTVVLGDVVGRLEVLRELWVPNPSPEHLRPRGLGALASVLVVVVHPASARMAPSRGLLPRAGNLLLVVLSTLTRRLLLLVGLMPSVDSVSYVTASDPLLDRGSIRLHDRFGRCMGLQLATKLLALAYRSLSRHRTLDLLHRRSLEQGLETCHLSATLRVFRLG